jgi:hypothetical protein
VQLETLASTLIEGLHHSRFLILGDPADAATLDGRWNHVDAKPVSR